MKRFAFRFIEYLWSTATRRLVYRALPLLPCLALIASGAHATTVFSVSSTTGWQDTGIDLSVGDTLRVTASGSIRYDSAGNMADPDGNPDGGKEFKIINLVPGAPTHTLVGRIGGATSLDDLSGFLIGSNFAKGVSSAGRLYLGFNDGFVVAGRTGLNGGGVGDNSGSYSSNIDVDAGVFANVPLIASSLFSQADGSGISSVANLAANGTELGQGAASGVPFGELALLPGVPNLGTCYTSDNCPDHEIFYKAVTAPVFVIPLPSGIPINEVSFDFLPLDFESNDWVFAAVDGEIIFSISGADLVNEQRVSSGFLPFPSGLPGNELTIGIGSNTTDRRLIVNNVEFFQTPIPEPSSLALLFGGLAALGAAMRRKLRL